MATVDAPRDKYNAVWIVFFVLGLGTLLPWSFFATATTYFASRLKDDATPNATVVATALESKFKNVMTLCAMLPPLIFTALNPILVHRRVPEKLRISGSLAVILLVFALTAALVKANVPPLPFFVLTTIKIVCVSSFGAVFQSSLFGLAGLFPADYTTAVMSGQGLAGTFGALAMICALATGSRPRDSAFGYFVAACVVIFLCATSYVALPRMEFFRHYAKRRDGSPKGPPTTSGVVVFEIFKRIRAPALSVCFVFFVTVGAFPAVTADVKTTVANYDCWDAYFVPVACFLLFNATDWAGRSLTAVCAWPGKAGAPALAGLRIVFVPLFMLCNVSPRRHLPVLFHHDAWYVVFMVLFAFSNGSLAGLCMRLGPKGMVPRRHAETAGAIMTFFSSLGLALGAAFSFAVRALV